MSSNPVAPTCFNQAMFRYDQKVKTKTETWKELLRWNKRHLKGLSLKQIEHFFFEGESPTLKLTSHGILHYLWSADLSKSFFQLFLSTFTFPNLFSIAFDNIYNTAILNIFIIKKLALIKWVVIIPYSLRLLLKVWIWYRCQNRKLLSPWRRIIRI